MRTFKVLVFVLAALTLSAEASVTSAKLSRNPQGDAVIEASLVTAAPPAAVWAFLTDYDRIGAYVTSMERSHVISRQSNTAVVEQIGRWKVGPLQGRFGVVLQIAENPGAVIAFRDMLHRDFEFYEGTWSMAPTPNGTKIDYRLNARFASALMTSLVGEKMRAATDDLLAEVGRELDRRASR